MINENEEGRRILKSEVEKAIYDIKINNTLEMMTYLLTC